MDANKFLEYSEVFISAREIDKAVEFYEDMKAQFKLNSETLTLSILYKIHGLEKAAKESSFFEEGLTISELIERFHQLKFYLRRFDFGVHYDTQDFMEFVKRNHISGSAIVCVASIATLHPINVLNEAAMTFLDYKEYLLALRVLNVVYSNSQDDVTIFNLAQVLWCCGKYEAAQKMVEQIKSDDPSVEALKTMIQEKLA